MQRKIRFYSKLGWAIQELKQSKYNWLPTISRMSCKLLYNVIAISYQYHLNPPSCLLSYFKNCRQLSSNTIFISTKINCYGVWCYINPKLTSSFFNVFRPHWMSFCRTPVSISSASGFCSCSLWSCSWSLNASTVSSSWCGSPTTSCFSTNWLLLLQTQLIDKKTHWIAESDLLFISFPKELITVKHKFQKDTN